MRRRWAFAGSVAGRRANRGPRMSKPCLAAAASIAFMSGGASSGGGKTRSVAGLPTPLMKPSNWNGLMPTRAFAPPSPQQTCAAPHWGQTQTIPGQVQGQRLQRRPSTRLRGRRTTRRPRGERARVGRRPCAPRPRRAGWSHQPALAPLILIVSSMLRTQNASPSSFPNRYPSCPRPSEATDMEPSPCLFPENEMPSSRVMFSGQSGLPVAEAATVSRRETLLRLDSLAEGL